MPVNNITPLDGCIPPECELPDPTKNAAPQLLCKSDGSPILVFYSANENTADCEAPDQMFSCMGWIDLAVDQETLQPCPFPADASVCGERSDFDNAGLLCDILPDGTVVGQAWYLITYDEVNGTQQDIRLVGFDFTAQTYNDPYTVQGSLELCPSEDVDPIRLCDYSVSPAVPFIRYYSTKNGQVLFDRTIDGQVYIVGDETEVRSCDITPVERPICINEAGIKSDGRTTMFYVGTEIVEQIFYDNSGNVIATPGVWEFGICRSDCETC